MITSSRQMKLLLHFNRAKMGSSACFKQTGALVSQIGIRLIWKVSVSDKRLTSVLFAYNHLPVTVIRVEHCEVLQFTEFVDKVIRSRKLIGILDYHVVKIPVINTEIKLGFFGTNSIRAAHSNIYGSMIPPFICLSIYFCSSSRVFCAAQNGGDLNGLSFGTR